MGGSSIIKAPIPADGNRSHKSPTVDKNSFHILRPTSGPEQSICGIHRHMISRLFLFAASRTFALAAPLFSRPSRFTAAGDTELPLWTDRPSPATISGRSSTAAGRATRRSRRTERRPAPFIKLADASEREGHAIAESFANAPKRDLTGQQVGYLYASFMDEAKIDRLGAAPLKPISHRLPQHGLGHNCLRCSI